jgi:hypothetical protein
MFTGWKTIMTMNLMVQECQILSHQWAKPKNNHIYTMAPSKGPDDGNTF